MFSEVIENLVFKLNRCNCLDQDSQIGIVDFWNLLHNYVDDIAPYLIITNI
jgi:hypothetical protein